MALNSLINRTVAVFLTFFVLQTGCAAQDVLDASEIFAETETKLVPELSTDTGWIELFWQLSLFATAALFIACALIPQTLVSLQSMPWAFQLRYNLDLEFQALTYEVYHSNWWSRGTHYILIPEQIAWFTLLAAWHPWLPVGVFAVLLFQAVLLGEHPFSALLGIAEAVVMALGYGVLALAGPELAIPIAKLFLIAAAAFRVTGHLSEPVPPMLVEASDRFVPLRDVGVHPKLFVASVIGYVSEFASAIPGRLFLVQVYQFALALGYQPQRTSDRETLRSCSARIQRVGWKTHSAMASLFNTVLQSKVTQRSLPLPEKRIHLKMSNNQGPRQVAAKICAELDMEGWKPADDSVDVTVLTRYGACGSDIIGFKTITEHPISQKRLLTTLQDVIGAMEAMNKRFAHGETLEAWPTDFDESGQLVRTSFILPTPMRAREFLHGLHVLHINANTAVVAYTPVDRPDIPVQQGSIRCPMYASGQRITQLDNGVSRVEHLMVYQLGGSTPGWVQDHLLKHFHIRAYKKEWRKLREITNPPPAQDVQHERLTQITLDAVRQSRKWPIKYQRGSSSVAVGRLTYCPRTAIRTETIVDAPIERVVEVLGDQSITYLPKWNREFVDGVILRTLKMCDKLSTEIARVHYQTPPGIANREYVYYFSREWVSKNEAIILYQSVHQEEPSGPGKVTAQLYPSIHRCVSCADGSTLIEHVLTTDLGGRLGCLQDRFLQSGLISANARDLEAQQELFQKQIRDV